MKFLHISQNSPGQRLFPRPFKAELAKLGELTIVEKGQELPDARRAELIRECDVLLTGWGAAMTPAELAARPGRLRYICHITGEMRRYIPLELIESNIPVTNWGDSQANGVAEGAMTLLLAAMKDLHRRVELVRAGGWRLDESICGGSLEGLAVGIYGMGVIARRFVEMLRPFGAIMKAYDPFVAEFPAGVARVNSLDELFTGSQAIVIHAGLTPQTKSSVTARLLAMLPDHGVVVNTARGGVVEQAALFAELRSGRLRAGLDVLEPDLLEPDHEARQWENLILTCHMVGMGWPQDPANPRMERMHHVCLENLRRFQAGQPLQFVMDKRRYELST